METLNGTVLLGDLNNGLNPIKITPYLSDVIEELTILLTIDIAREVQSIPACTDACTVNHGEM
ncbi:hypothetical protein [Qingshengfaniella alkalisoli]|uniref:Uncharacterized protein n=1 Tax=Qingshengfaniella alkalisoli TaxID=2599296 RepID=A0A5B8IZK0_9RHOB|nr:hypothetical protein FPZ52_15440 [Qingshengfaniella alkalisoli]